MISMHGLLRPRFTIGQMMLVILVIGLALAPIEMILRHTDPRMIAALLGFETIGLPTLVTIVLMATMEPGRARTRLIVLLSLLPVLLVLAIVSFLYVWTLLFGMRTQNRDIVFHTLIVLLVVGTQVWIGLPPRCPSCRRRRLRQVSYRAESPHAGYRTERFECVECGRHSSRVKFQNMPGPMRIEAEPTASSSRSESSS
jgi:hypothetical protein